MYCTPLKRTKNDARGPDRVKIYRVIKPGIELAAEISAHSSVPILTRIQINDLLLAISRYSARSIG